MRHELWVNVNVQLLVAADQFLLEPMKRKCEKILSEKIDSEVRPLLTGHTT